MKFYLLLLIICLSFTGQSQDTLMTYFDEDWHKIKEKSEASYYRKAYKVGKKHWVFEDYYINGGLQMKGHYTSKKEKNRNGYFKFYYEGGQVEYEGKYVDDERHGKWIFYHENGQISSNVNYLEGKHDGDQIYYYDNGQIKQKGTYENGRRSGKWIYYFESGALYGEILYSFGEAKKVRYWSEDGIEQEEDLEIAVAPEYPGGQDSLTAFIARNFVYPEESRMMGEKGIVYIQFVVTETGNIEDVKVVKSVSERLDAEAIRVIKAMPKWKPGKQLNKPVKVRYTIPIRCTLEVGKKKKKNR